MFQVISVIREYVSKTRVLYTGKYGRSGYTFKGRESQKEYKTLPFQPPASIWFSTETALTVERKTYIKCVKCRLSSSS